MQQLDDISQTHLLNQNYGDVCVTCQCVTHVIKGAYLIYSRALAEDHILPHKTLLLLSAIKQPSQRSDSILNGNILLLFTKNLILFIALLPRSIKFHILFIWHFIKIKQKEKSLTSIMLTTSDILVKYI